MRSSSKSAIDTAVSGRLMGWPTWTAPARFIRALRNSGSSVQNAADVPLERQRANWNRVFIPGAGHLGHFTKYGQFAPHMIVTLEDATACFTPVQAKPQLPRSPDNLEAVCEEDPAAPPWHRNHYCRGLQAGRPVARQPFGSACDGNCRPALT